MFLGISFLASRAHPLPSETKSVVAQIADGVFSHGFMYYLVQVFTAAILILAANTSYQDFPRLSSILARDRFLPRQFENRGDRLVFSNGVIVLAIFASLLIWAFDANLDRLIQLYVVGVFTSFTLSQSGMVRHWQRVRDRGGTQAKGWRRSAIINAIGALATGLVLIVVIQTKFIHGAWIVIAAMPVIVSGFYGVHRHYEWISAQLRSGAVTISETPRNTVVLYVEDLNDATARAVGYIRSFAGRDFQAIHPQTEHSSPDIAARWGEFSRTSTPLRVLPRSRHPAHAVLEHVRSIPREDGDFITVVIPELIPRRSLLSALRGRTAFYLKLRLLGEPQVVITDVPVVPEPGQTDGRPLLPRTTEALVFISSVHDPAIRAINYARSLRAMDVRAVFFALDAQEIEDIGNQWAERRVPVALDIVEAPFRDLTAPILQEVRRITSRPDALACVIVPELVVKKWWHNFLHNHRPVFIKRLLLFEPRVVLSSVPYQLR